MPQSDQLVEQILISLRRITRAIDLHSKVLAQRYGLTVPQLMILRELSHQEHLSIGRLADAVSLSSATVTGIVERLGKRGLLEKKRSSEDRRLILTSITDEGRRLVEVAPPLLQKQFAEQLTSLRDWEQTLILSSLQRVDSMMEARDLSAAPVLVSGPVSQYPEQTREFLEDVDGRPESEGPAPPVESTT